MQCALLSSDGPDAPAFPLKADVILCPPILTKMYQGNEQNVLIGTDMSSSLVTDTIQEALKQESLKTLALTEYSPFMLAFRHKGF